MKLLEERILKEGKVIDNSILKIDYFLNWNIDTKLLKEIAKDIVSNFSGVTKILTIEASGIAFGTAVALEYGNIPMTFAKKSSSSVNANEESYTTNIYSFTHNKSYTAKISKRFLNKGDKVLIVDDFLAGGNASIGLVDLCKQAKAEVLGVAAVVEKSQQGGRDKLEKLGIKVYSCARILEFKDNIPIFFKE